MWLGVQRQLHCQLRLRKNKQLSLRGATHNCKCYKTGLSSLLPNAQFYCLLVVLGAVGGGEGGGCRFHKGTRAES